MEIKDQIEQSRFLIDRYDRFFQVVDIKGNILCAYHLFVIGGIIINYSTLLNLLCLGQNGPVIFFWLVFALVLSSLISLFFIFRAIHPFLESAKSKSSKKKENAHSLIFFKSVYEMGQNKFNKKFSEQSLKEMADDYRLQTYMLAKGLTNKIERVRIAGAVCYFHLMMAGLIMLMKLL